VGALLYASTKGCQSDWGREQPRLDALPHRRGDRCHPWRRKRGSNGSSV